MELQRQESNIPPLDIDKPILSSDDLVAQQQFAHSVPVIERDTKQPLWVALQQQK